MKKLSLILALVIAGITFFSSCTEDTNPPTMNFLGGSGYVSENTTVDAGTTVKIGVTAQSGSAKLTNFEIEITHNNISQTLLDTTFSLDTYTENFLIPIVNVGESRLTFTITDKDGETAQLALVITANEVNNITTYTEKILGSYDNSTYGSSFASVDGTVYKLKDARENAAKIDWMYFYGVSNLATIASPDDSQAATIFNGTNGLQTWTTKNATRFQKITGGAVWDNITTAADIADLVTNPTLTLANELQVGNIVGFKTVTGKYGLIKVTAITTGGDGSITYDVKVQ